MKEGLKTAEIRLALREKYAAPAYAFLTEVPNATGTSAGRWADGIAMSLWPSRGLHLTGFEIKASRSDWLSELKKPAKAESIAQYCDYWYLAVGSADIVQPGELPPNWGLMVPHGKRLRIEKEAPVLTPQPLNRSFLAALLRKVDRESVDKDQYEERIQRLTAAANDRYHQGVEFGKTFNIGPAVAQDLEFLRDRVKQFEEASGIAITDNRWNKTHPRELGIAVRMIADGSVNEILKSLHRTKTVAKVIIENIETLESVSSLQP